MILDHFKNIFQGLLCGFENKIIRKYLGATALNAGTGHWAMIMWS
jgi:hypothetical protein